MSEKLNNPMRFSIRPRTIDVGQYLRSSEFDDKQITEVEIEPGQLYIHWEHIDE